MGLSAPETYEALLDVIAAWLESGEDEGIRLFEYSMDWYRDIFDIIYKARIQSCQAVGETPTFDDPEVRALLKRLEALRPALDAIEPIYNWSSEDATLLNWDVNPLPRDYAFATGDAQPLPLRFDNEIAPVIPADMDVLAVNPYSENADLAIMLLEYMAQHMPAPLETALMPDRNEPIEVQGYQENLACLREFLAETERQLTETVSEEDQVILKERIEEVKLDIAFEERHRWAYTAEEVAFYREQIEPHMTYSLSTIFTLGREQTENVCSRYLDGQLTLDEFVREFDRIVWMMTMENR